MYIYRKDWIVYILFLFFFGFFSKITPEESNFIWPIDTDSIEQKLTSVFGESRGDHFHNGLDISSDNEPIRSIGNGNIIYSRYNSDHPFEGEFGSGNCVWINHGKKTLSAYYHMKNGRQDGLLNKTSIKKGEVIGRSGNTGHSSGSHLHFVIARDNGRKIINPFSVLTPVVDSKPPQIGPLILSIGENYTYINDGDNIRVSKPFPITVQILDTGEKKGQRRGIFEVEFTINGKTKKKNQFNEIELSGRYWKNESGLKFDELYFNGNYYITESNFESGNNTIIVKATDYNGNSSVKSFTFNVSRIK